MDSVEVFLIALCLPAAVASGSDARRVRSQSQRPIRVLAGPTSRSSQAAGTETVAIVADRAKL